MKRSWMTRIMGVIAVAAVIAVVPGCSQGVDGDYKDASGIMSMELHGGKATVKMGTESKEGEYKVDGDKVTITPKGDQPLTLTRQSDGSLKGDIVTLTRK